MRSLSALVFAAAVLAPAFVSAQPEEVSATEPLASRPTEDDPCREFGLHFQQGAWFLVQVGEELTIVFEANPLPPECYGLITYTATGFDPRDATFEADSKQGRLHYHPVDPSSIGTQHVVFSATYRDLVHSETCEVEIAEEWETYFMPGVQYSLFLPADHAELGLFHGVSVEYLLAAWIHRNENRGPSHGRIYANIELLHSTTAGVSEMLLYHLGLDLSVERNPKRSWFIPFFGLEAGGMYQRELGGMGQLVPMGGVRVYGSRNLFLNVIGGYLFPTSHLEELRGWRARAGLNLSLW